MKVLGPMGPSPPPVLPAHDWLAGDAQMAELIRAHDWSLTPLGSIDGWPPGLRTAVSLCLASSVPIDIIWGPQAIQVYNGGYRDLCGAAHPRALGESYRVTWAAAWPAIGAAFEAACRGEIASRENQRMFLQRKGALEETFFTLSLSPIRDDAGNVAGVFHPAIETTAAVLGERRTRALRAIAVEAGSIESVDAACGHILQALAPYRYDVPFAILYRLDGTGGAAHLLGAAGLAASTDASIWPLRAVLDSGQGQLVHDVADRVGRIPCADYPEPTASAFIVPLRAGAGVAPFGFAVLGLSTRLPFDPGYLQFVDMLGQAMGAAIGAALALQADKRRADHLQDLTDQRQARIATEKTVAQLKQERELRERFVLTLAHDLRSPIQVVQMAGALIAHQLADPHALLDTAQRIDRNAALADAMICDLLDANRLEAGGGMPLSVQPCDLVQVLDKTTVELAQRYGARFRVVRPQGPMPGLWDGPAIRRVVENLADNAIKYGKRGAPITLALERVAGAVELAVHNEGEAIPVVEQSAIFDPFYRARSAATGTQTGWGVGLTLVRGIAEAHGGSARVHSNAAAGTTFFVRLPVRPPT